jgi:hypothetical protein
MHVRTLTLCAIALLLASASAAVAGAAVPSSSACTAPGYHGFDYWIGDWDVYDIGGKAVTAHVRVTSILNGCGILEEYLGSDGSRGESLSTYDPAHGVWRQFWVSNTGEIVDISGGLVHGAMTLTGPEEGTRSLMVRGIWQPQGHGVRETGLQSSDHGRTWSPWFDLLFRPASRSAKR